MAGWERKTNAAGEVWYERPAGGTAVERRYEVVRSAYAMSRSDGTMERTAGELVHLPVDLGDDLEAEPADERPSWWLD